MKLTVTPLLEGKQARSIDVKGFNTRNFVDLMDRHKALLIQAKTTTTDSNNDNNNTNQKRQPSLSVEDFGHFLVDLDLEYYPYIGGAAPRTIIPVAAGKDIIFTANESPPDQPIPFHHELAQTSNPPAYVFFYCEVPASEGGQTPIIDSTSVYRFAKENHPDFIDKLLKHGARYIRTLPAEDDPSSPIGRSYKNTWQVSNEHELEDKLSKMAGYSWEWQPDGSVRVTSEAVPGLRLVKDLTQNYVFQYTFMNSIVAAHLGWQDERNDRFDALRFGDMSPMPKDVLESIAEFMHEHRTLYSWKRGDILALHNHLVMHSRNPFVGKRRVLASIWGPPKQSTLHEQPPNNVALGEIPRSYRQPLQPSDPLVFGFWKVPKEQCAKVCYDAIAAGYRRLDCACDYGNEKQVGDGIQRALQDGLCERSDLFITSKLWNTYHAPEHVPLALRKTLADLQLDYLDEYLIHFPISMEFVPFEAKYPPEWTNLDNNMRMVANDMCATWRAMEALVDEQLIRGSIGVCNFTTQLLRQILSTCRIRPQTLQVELHPHNTQELLVRFAREAGMRVTAFSILGAQSYLELDMAKSEDILIQDDSVVGLAKSKCKTPAQILIRWALQRNTLPLCKTSNVGRMNENRDVFDFHLTPEEMQILNGLNKNRRYNDPGAFAEPGMGTFCPIYE